MPTPHETVAAAVVSALAARFEGEGDPVVTREIDLPEACPPAGLVNVRFDDAIELGRQLGPVAREWSRICRIEIAVQHPDAAERINRFEALLTQIGPLHSAGSIAGAVDWINMSPPVEADVLPIEGASTIKAATVEVTLFYRTGDNPMEALT